MAKRKRLTPLGPMGAPAPTSAPAGSEPQADSARQRITTELGLAPESTIVLSVGSSFSTKGVDRSITAMSWTQENPKAPGRVAWL